MNLWALYYEEWTHALAPFASRDVDVLGDRGTLLMLARAAGVQPQFFSSRTPTNEIGVVVAKDSNGHPLLVEVLRHVHGVTNEELRAPVYTVAVGSSRVAVRVPGPIALMKAKVADVADLAQSGRQDARHVRILAQLMPAYLGDLVTSVAKGGMRERALVDLLERLLTVVTSRNAGRVLGTLGIPRRVLFAELATGGVPRVRRFIEERLPRMPGQ